MPLTAPAQVLGSSGLRPKFALGRKFSCDAVVSDILMYAKNKDPPNMWKSAGAVAGTSPLAQRNQYTQPQFSRGQLNTALQPVAHGYGFAGAAAPLARPTQRPPPVTNRPIKGPSRCACG